MTEASTGMTENGPLTIGEVINLLREDFPDVSVSKVRFLESQGLVSPERSTSGYRLYDQSDLGRLRFVLQQQRDHFLPLKVIKSKLTMWERGEEGGGGDIEPSEVLGTEGEPLSRHELQRKSGLADQQLAELEEHGLLEAHEGLGGLVYPGESLRVALEARRLLAQGLEPRHLRMLRLAAEREAELLRQLTAPLLRLNHSETRRRAEETMAVCAEAMAEIHRTILGTRLRQILEV